MQSRVVRPLGSIASAIEQAVVVPKVEPALTPSPVIPFEKFVGKRKSKVSWSPDEEALVVNEVADLRILDPSPHLIQLINKAQEKVLPPHRQRAVSAINAFPGLVERITAKVVELTSSTPEIVRVEVPQVPKEVPLAEVLAGVSLAQLVTLIAERFESRFDRIESLLSRGAVEAPSKPAQVHRPHVPVTEAEPRKRKVRIAVIGLLPSQFTTVQERSRTADVDLSYVNRDQSATAVPVSTDYVIVSKWVSHRWWEAARKQLPTDRVFFIDGGITQIIQKVFDLNARKS